MTYTNEEYADMAIKANKEGKLLKIIDGELRLVEPEPIALSDEQIITQNKAKQSSLINEANGKIAVIQDIIDLDMQEADEEAELKQWKKYRVLLNRIDVEQADKIQWPSKT